MQGRIRKGRRDPAPIALDGPDGAWRTCCRSGTGTQTARPRPGPTPHEVLDQGVVYFLDTTGVAGGGRRALGGPGRPGRSAPGPGLTRSPAPSRCGRT